MKKLSWSNALLFILLVVLSTACNREEVLVEEMNPRGITARMVMDEVHLASIGKGNLVGNTLELPLQEGSISEEAYAFLVEHLDADVNYTWTLEQFESVIGRDHWELSRDGELSKTQNLDCVFMVFLGPPRMVVEVCPKEE